MNRLRTLFITIIFILVLPIVSFADSIDDPNSDWFAGELTNIDIESAEIPRDFSFNDGNGQEFKYSINKIDTTKYENYTDFDYIIKVSVSKVNTPEVVWWDVEDLIKGFDDDLSWYLGDQPKISLITRGAAVLLEDKEVATLKDELPVQLNVSRRVYGLTRYFSNHTDNSGDNPYDYYAGDYFTEQMVHEKMCYKLENISSRMSVDQGYGFKIPYYKWEDVKKIDKSSWDYSFPTEYNFGGIIYFEYAEDSIKSAIDELPEADAITLEDKETIEAARAQYDALSEESKVEITNYAKLQLAEAVIAKLEAEQELTATKEQLNLVSTQLENALADNTTAQNTITELNTEVDKAKEDLKTVQNNLESANKALADAKETIKIQKVTIKKVKAKAKKKSALVSWKTVGKGYTYDVYRSTNPTKAFKKVKTLSKLKVTVKKLKKGKVYYFKVRAFKKVAGKKVYTQYSNIVKVKAK